MKAADQREIIEQLLGITKLSDKAEKLKLLIKDNKDIIKQEEYHIDATKDANKKHEENIMVMYKSARFGKQNKL